jgi:hypothetical protein
MNGVKVLQNYKWLIIAVTLLVLPSIFIMYAYPGSIQNACSVLPCSSGSTPLGAILSLFTFDTWIDVMYAAVGVFLLWAINMKMSDKAQSRRSVFTAVFMYVPAIFVNLIFVVIAPSGSSFYGPSAVYGLAAILIAFNILNIISFRRVSIGNEKYANAFVFIIMMIWLYFNRHSFVSAAQGIPMPIHGVVFIISFVGTIIYWGLARHSL